MNEIEPNIDMRFYHCKNLRVIADVSWGNLTVGKAYYPVEFFSDLTIKQQCYFNLKDDRGIMKILKTDLFRTVLLSPMGQQEKEEHFRQKKAAVNNEPD